MPLTTFNPPIAPTPGTKHLPKVKLLKAQFGDGYSQVAPLGLNHIANEISLRWVALTEAQFVAIRQFFEDRGGYRPFWYQPRGFTLPQKWTAPAWSGKDAAPWGFEVQLMQWFGTEGDIEEYWE